MTERGIASRAFARLFATVDVALVVDAATESLAVPITALTKKICGLALVAGLTAVLGLVPTASPAMPISKTPLGDAGLLGRTSPNAQDTNKGSTAGIGIGRGGPGTDVQRAIFLFDFSDLAGTDAVGDGTLSLVNFDNAVSFAGHSVDLYLMTLANSDWVEAEVTWNNKETSPATPWTGGSHDFGTTILDSSSGPFTTGSTFTLTISEATLDQAITNGVLSLLLKSNSAEAASGERSAIISFREDGAPNIPTLAFSVAAEPSAAILLGLGFVGLVSARRRARQ